LTLSGTRTEPHAQALVAAREVPQAFASWRPVIQQALFEHYEPYAEAVTAGELPPRHGLDCAEPERRKLRALYGREFEKPE
jgi:hypothetical protein